MLEACQRKHMFLGLSVLVSITIVVLLLESHFAISDSEALGRSQQFFIENNSTCWMREHFIIVEECHPCTDFDIVSNSLGVCVHTKYKEILRCDSGETVTRSCDRVALIDQRKFASFEIFCLIVSIIAYIISCVRSHTLFQRSLSKLERRVNRVT